MNINYTDERKRFQYNGFYRAKIVDISDLKNGVYKVRVYPFFAEVNEEDLPFALSNMTNRFSHISLKKDDWVWVFFENGCLNYPIIFDFCNVKGKFPLGSDGEKPDYYDEISFEQSIGEGNVSYSGEYNNVDCFDFDGIKIEIDKKNKQLVIFSDNFYIIIDKDKKLHLKYNSAFIKVEDVLGIKVNGLIMKILDSKMLLKNNLSNIYEILIDIKGILSDIYTDLRGVNGSQVINNIVSYNMPLDFLNKVITLETSIKNLFLME